ncbi:helix-turn-helix domain-containing protein [Burkholderia pseudomallei]|uniref:helix-turn-helix domain-containing protein n=1 Tax=Burkholderia pseudomallei TaxID=28450 RepID=UPI000DCFE11C|nr:helix-turn-helix domain-containing protein [Burkholderia pseudomallei]
MTDLVFKRYPVGGGEFTLALALADYANADGTQIFPSVQTMARKSRQSRRTVQYQIRRMEKSGWLIACGRSHGGRGKTQEYRINPDWINAPPAAISQSANNDTKDATGDNKGANGDVKGGKSFAPKPSVTVIDSSKKHQPARKSTQVAMYAEIRAMPLPDWLSASAWAIWCAHREAKAASGNAPWLITTAEVSIHRLDELRSQGQLPAACIKEAALRGWTGLFPVKGSTAQVADLQHGRWWLDAPGITKFGATMGLAQKSGEVFKHFTARVFKAAGPGEWQEQMLREEAKFGVEHYETLYRYFLDSSMNHPAAKGERS